ncbi:MAG: DUF1824 family protein [Okeania sp. SIO3I5]|uniref:DUF1824 family protein n=1 Tax=Okeania sp. SIO3I5 TaxID=2607805 RepID=UPI0013B90940|nr:DUF1824 family protein [Okeania sp. SIO3I5]NEQ38602.1 DUF1824 family protein [Okeania sp. SIO3I5]
MSTQNIHNLTVSQAEKFLNEFTCQDIKVVESQEEKAIIRAAILLLANLSDYQMLGICANSTTEALYTLGSYLEGLGYNTTLMNESNLNSIPGSVYLKFNGMKESYIVEPYIGKYRGVLVSCQSAEEKGINGTYGYLPLDLFIEN